MDKYGFWLYLLVMAGVTYLVRMLPLVLVKRKITNRFILSFLHYVPYAVLTVMTVPAALYATGSEITAAAALLAALVLAWRRQSLLVVAAGAVAGALLGQGFLTYLLPLLCEIFA